MRLPADDSVELDASDDGPLVIDRSDPTTLTLDDLKALLPAWTRGGTSDVRDALLQTWGTMTRVMQARAGFLLAAQASPRYAEGTWLDFWGRLLGKPRYSEEIDSDYRQRLLIAVDVVSPTAIKTAVQQILTALIPNSNFAVNYQEPAIDMAYAGPATATDPVNPNSYQQSGLPDWQAFTQPQIVTTGIGLHQSVYDGVNFRLWANYPDSPTKKIGAFSVPWIGFNSGSPPQFWLVLPGAVEDDSETPHCEAVDADSDDYLQYDFTQGINGQDTAHQTVVTGASSPADAYGLVAGGSDSLVDKLQIEIERRRAAGVYWLVLLDFPSSLQF